MSLLEHVTGSAGEDKLEIYVAEKENLEAKKKRVFDQLQILKDTIKEVGIENGMLDLELERWTGQLEEVFRPLLGSLDITIQQKSNPE